VRIQSGGDWSAEGPAADRRNGTFEFPVTRGTFRVEVLDARSEVAGDLYTGTAGGSEAYDWEVVFRHTTMPAEPTTDENGTPLPTRTPTQTSSPSPTPISAGRNIAPEANRRSASANEADLGLLIDGSASTFWNSLLYPSSSPGDPPFVRFDFDQPREVEGIELVVAQTPNGNTVHELWLMDEDGEWGTSAFTTFQQNTSDGQTLAYRISPAKPVLAVYVRTTRSPSFVAWREVRIFSPITPPGGVATSTPTVTATPISAGRNIAPDVTPTASTNGANARLAADHDANTVWDSGKVPSSVTGDLPSIEFYYPQPQRIEAIQLVVAQSVAGNTVHEVWLMDEEGAWDDTPVTKFDQYTSDGQTLGFHLNAVRQVRRVYVRTTNSPSSVAWREVRIFAPITPPGGFPIDTPTITPTISGSLSTVVPTGIVAIRIPEANASSMEATPSADFAPRKAIDGTPTTSWRPAGPTPTATPGTAQLTIDLSTDNAGEYDPSSDRLAAFEVEAYTATGIPHTYSLGVIFTDGSAHALATCGFSTSLSTRRTCVLSSAYSGVWAITIGLSPADGSGGVSEVRAWRTARSTEVSLQADAAVQLARLGMTALGAGPYAAPSPSATVDGRSLAIGPAATTATLAGPSLRAQDAPPRSTAGGRVEFILLLETKPGVGYR